MKKLMGVMLGFFVVSFPVQSNIPSVFKNLDGQCPTGYCACAGCDQCSPNDNPSGCTNAGCLPNCVNSPTPASLYSISPLAQGAIFYCVGGAKIQPITEVPSNYAGQNWYTCGPSRAFPTNNPSPAPLTTAYAAYSFQPGDIFACPAGEIKTFVSGVWFTCSIPKVEDTPDSSASLENH